MTQPKPGNALPASVWERRAKRGEIFRKYRKACRLTQYQLADMLTVDRGVVHNYEHGRMEIPPPLMAAMRLAAVWSKRADDRMRSMIAAGVVECVSAGHWAGDEADNGDR